MSSTPAITEFRVHIDDAQIDDLHERLARTRWPDKETVDDWSQGIPLSYVQELCDYWTSEYDMRRLERRLNAFPQFKTEIDGLDVHFVHVRSTNDDATPLLMTHGWPGSLVEFLEVIEPLREHFHIVCPTLPGFGFSDRPARTGFGVHHIGQMWAELMARLDYDRYFVQGGDFGSFVTIALASAAPEHVLGIHLNTAFVSPEALAALGEPTPEEKEQLELVKHYLDWEGGYSDQQSTRPQTLAYGLADSPAGQCAWIAEKFFAWTDNDGHPEDAVSRDDILDNVMMYWLTGSAASSARLYWESYKRLLTEFDEVAVPSAYTAFPDDTFHFSERWTRTRFTDLRYYNRVGQGGHFAALEEPDLFVSEVRRAFDAISGAAGAGATGPTGPTAIS
jgi:pimeloyl-ACP methyl ester carboxylesterase